MGAGTEGKLGDPICLIHWPHSNKEYNHISNEVLFKWDNLVFKKNQKKKQKGSITLQNSTLIGKQEFWLTKKIVKNIRHSFPEPKVTSSDSLFSSTNGPKPKDIQYFIEDYKNKYSHLKGLL